MGSRIIFLYTCPYRKQPGSPKGSIRSVQTFFCFHTGAALQQYRVKRISHWPPTCTAKELVAKECNSGRLRLDRYQTHANISYSALEVLVNVINKGNFLQQHEHRLENTQRNKILQEPSWSACVTHSSVSFTTHCKIVQRHANRAADPQMLLSGLKVSRQIFRKPKCR